MAEIAKPLYGALEKNGRHTLIWTEETNEEFMVLKDRTKNSIALNIPNFSKKFVLVTDASIEAIGEMLANREGNQLTGQTENDSFLSPYTYFRRETVLHNR